jgi:hypothetical protein
MSTKIAVARALLLAGDVGKVAALYHARPDASGACGTTLRRQPPFASATNLT